MSVSIIGSHSVEKIGGTSMSDYQAVRDNIIFKPQQDGFYKRIFVVSAYAGITDKLLEQKKTGRPGLYALFSTSMQEDSWMSSLGELQDAIFSINKRLFIDDEVSLKKADRFIGERIEDAKSCLKNLQRLCKHGHFALESHIEVVKEMLASIGEAHSAWNLAQLLKTEGINAKFIDLTAWKCETHVSLDERIEREFKNIDLSEVLPICTGYAHCDTGLMSTFKRGYSEMTFSRVAVLTQACEAVIHKEFHLSSADPNIVGEGRVVPIGRTNYDVSDQLANLGMEAIHPKAAKGLRKHGIPLRVKNTFEPEHGGTLITKGYVSARPQVEIIAGCKGVYAIELFDQDMTGDIGKYDIVFSSILCRFKARVVGKDINANTITHYVSTNLKTVKRICDALRAEKSEVDISQQKVAIVSAIGSDMKIPGILSRAVEALAKENISVLAVHQSMRQVNMQFVVDEENYTKAVCSLHRCLVEIHDHGRAICLAS